MRMQGFCVVAAWALALAAGGGACAQELLPQPDLYIGAPYVVTATARQPDGGVIFGGLFTSVNGVPRGNLARLKPDGTLDRDWNAPTDGNVYAIAVDGTNVYVGGSFTRVGDVAREHIVKLDGATGAVAPDFAPAPNGQVNTIAVDGGALYIGGWFDHVGDDTRIGLAKLSAATGALVAGWEASCDIVWQVLVIDAFVYVSGPCVIEGGGNTQARIARLARDDGTLDATWHPTPDDVVRSMATDGAGRLYVSGPFETIGDGRQPRLARLSLATGAVDATWNPAPDATPSAILISGGALYAAGNFGTIGGAARPGLARLDLGVGAADPAWRPQLDRPAVTLAALGDGRIVAGGGFTRVGDRLRTGMAVFGGDGALDAATANTGTPGDVRVIARQADGGTIIGGNFRRVERYERSFLARIKPDGSVDAAWQADTDAEVDAVAIDPAGSVFVGGAYTMIGGQPRAGLAKLSAAGAVDDEWNPAAPGTRVLALALDAGDAIYAGGAFDRIGDLPLRNLAKLARKRDGAPDPKWDPSPDGAVFALAYDGREYLYVGGNYATVGRLAHPHLARVSTLEAGAADPSWNPSPNGNVTAIALHGAAVYVAGRFDMIVGVLRRQLAKLGRDGSVDAHWNMLAVVDFVTDIAVDGAGRVYAAGAFRQLPGAPATLGLVRFPARDAQRYDPTWPRQQPDGLVYAVTVDRDEIRIGGAFTAIGGQSRHAFAAFADETIFADGWE